MKLNQLLVISLLVVMSLLMNFTIVNAESSDNMLVNNYGVELDDIYS